MNGVWRLEQGKHSVGVQRDARSATARESQDHALDWSACSGTDAVVLVRTKEKRSHAGPGGNASEKPGSHARESRHSRESNRPYWFLHDVVLLSSGCVTVITESLTLVTG